MRSHYCYLKRCAKNSLTLCIFYVMESRVSINCTRNIHRPSTPEKMSTEKEISWKEKATDSKVYAYSDIDLGEVLFHYVMFFEKESRDLSRKIYRVSFIGIS